MKERRYKAKHIVTRLNTAYQARMEEHDTEVKKFLETLSSDVEILEFRHQSMALGSGNVVICDTMILYVEY